MKNKKKTPVINSMLIYGSSTTSGAASRSMKYGKQFSHVRNTSEIHTHTQYPKTYKFIFKFDKKPMYFSLWSVYGSGRQSNRIRESPNGNAARTYPKDSGSCYGKSWSYDAINVDFYCVFSTPSRPVSETTVLHINFYWQ